MAIIKKLRGHDPRIGVDCYLAETAVIIGEVSMGKECSIWFNAVLRGDVNSIVLGNKVNVQDNATIHCTYQKSKTVIGNNVSIGHNAIVHGCTVEDNVLIGMGAIIMDHCHIGQNSIVAAGAVLTQGTIVEPGSIYAGVPARKLKAVSPELRSGEIQRVAQNYRQYASWYQKEG